MPIWSIHIFGAGHITQALVPVLLPLNCQLTIYDSRREWLNKLPQHPFLKSIFLETYQENIISPWIAKLKPSDYLLCLTQGHETDSAVLKIALQNPPYYVGVIGSVVKSQKLKKELALLGISQEVLEKIAMPIGEPLGGKTPAEIAISITAQLIRVKNNYSSPSM